MIAIIQTRQDDDHHPSRRQDVEHANRRTTALVSGANRGIGKAIAQALLDRGAAKVYAGVRNPATVSAADRRLVAVQLDVTDADMVTAVADELADVELVVNNAGIAHPATLTAGPGPTPPAPSSKPTTSP